jgi:hypothetical protein
VPGWMRPSAAPTGGEPRAARPLGLGTSTIPASQRPSGTPPPRPIAAAALLKVARWVRKTAVSGTETSREVTIEALTARHLTVGGVHTDACLDKRRCMPFYRLTRI